MCWYCANQMRVERMLAKTRTIKRRREGVQMARRGWKLSKVRLTVEDRDRGWRAGMPMDVESGRCETGECGWRHTRIYDAKNEAKVKNGLDKETSKLRDFQMWEKDWKSQYMRKQRSGGKSSMTKTARPTQAHNIRRPKKERTTGAAFPLLRGPSMEQGDVAPPT